jgi:hypothetical protein
MRVLNHFVNQLLSQSVERCIISYCATTNTYQLNADNIGALPIVNYMRRNNLTKLFNFTLHIEDDPHTYNGFHYILKIDSVAAP